MSINEVKARKENLKIETFSEERKILIPLCSEC